MKESDWKDLKDRFPALADNLLKAGSTLYELGVEKAQSAPELGTMMQLLKEAPQEARDLLGFGGPDTLDEKMVLLAVFTWGSDLLLNYVREGS